MMSPIQTGGEFPQLALKHDSTLHFVHKTYGKAPWQ